MSLFTNLAKTATAIGLSQQLGPAIPVSYTPALISCVVVFIILLIVMFFVLKVQDGGTENQNKTEAEKAAAKQNGIIMGVTCPLMISIIGAAILYKIQFSFANPGYAAASEGMNMLFNR